MPAVTLIRDSQGRVTSALVVGADPDKDRETLARLVEVVGGREKLLIFANDWTVTLA